MADHIEVIARGLLVVEGQVLLCRSVKAGYRYLPGGHVEPGEAAAEALRREFLEECGLEAVVGPLVFLSEERFHDGKKRRHELNLVFRVDRLGTPRSARGGGVFHVEHSALTGPVSGSPAADGGASRGGTVHGDKGGQAGPVPTGVALGEPGGAPGVFHVEHSGPQSDAGTDRGPGSGAGRRRAHRLPAVPSLEPKIAFDWVSLTEVAGSDVRPPSILAWLRGLGPDGAPPPLPFAGSVS